MDVQDPSESESDTTSFYTQCLRMPEMGHPLWDSYLYRANAEETGTSLGSFKDNIENQPGQVRH